MTCHGHPSVPRPPAIFSSEDQALDDAIATILGRPRDLSAPLPGVEIGGEALIEVAWIWQGLVIDVVHIDARKQSETGIPVRFEAGEALVTVQNSWEGWRERDGERRALQTGTLRPVGPDHSDLVLAPGEQVLVALGEARFLVRLTPSGARVAGRFSREVDLPFAGIMSFVSFLALIFGGVIATAPPPVEQTVIDIPERISELLLTVPAPPQLHPVARPLAPRDAQAGKRAPKIEGRSGRERGKRTARGGPDLERRRVDKEIAEDAGLLGALADAGELGGVFEAGMRDDLSAGIGSLHGALGVQMGTGFGQRGRGPGGGGDTVGSFRGTGTQGLSNGTSGDFSGGGDIGPKHPGDVHGSGDPIVIGGLERSVVDAVIKHHLASFRFCYQRALGRSPDLSGKVSIRFVIAHDGTVSKAMVKSSSLGNDMVEDCLSERFLRLRFPEPAGGGIVVVTYPFVFSRG
ncbi:MAG: AgmX/PglI C-terminal domain-containing protein [Oligoflexia bacterium]|nr:AgmX/PglI C-terminal domain-containing protein [Oligoflexia bacterium]